MRTYTAHLKPGRQPVLLREGWSWAAFVFGPMWLLAKRAWIPALLQLAAAVLLIRLAPAPYWPPALLGGALIDGVLGRDLVRWSLDRRGYELGHVVLAPDRDDALLRLLTARPELMGSMR